MQKSILVLFFLLPVIFSHAQKTNFTKLKDEAQFKNNFALYSQKTETVESDFVQTKNMSVLKDKLVSKGKFFFKKNNKVRIEYTSPYQYLMIINGNQMKVQDEKKSTNYNAHSNKILQSVNNIMLDCMQGNVYKNKDFEVNAMESAESFLLNLTPITTTMKKMFKNIEVFLDKNNYTVLKLNLIENGGDNTLMTFSNATLNKPISDVLFSTK